MHIAKEDLQKSVGNNIRKFRIAKKMYIESLALLADMDYTQLSRIELGKINTSVYQLYKIATILNVSLNELMDYG